MANKKSGVAVTGEQAAASIEATGQQAIYQIGEDIFAIGKLGGWATKIIRRDRSTGGRPSIHVMGKGRIPKASPQVEANPTIRRALGL